MKVSCVKPAAGASADSAARSWLTRATNSSALSAAAATGWAGTTGGADSRGPQAHSTITHSAPLAAGRVFAMDAPGLVHPRHHAFYQWREQQHNPPRHDAVPEDPQE